MMLKHLAAALLCCFSWGFATAQETYQVQETLSNGVPAGWQSTGVSTSSYSGKNCLSLSSGARLTTPALSNAGSVSFAHRSSGNGKELSLQKSTNGADWETVGSVTPSSSSAWGSSSITVNEGFSGVQLRFVASSATIYLADVVVSSLPGPVVTTNTDSLHLGTLFAGETSTPQEIKLQGYYLSGSINLSAAGVGFELSTDQTSYATTATIAHGAQMPVPLWVRYKAPQTTGQAQGRLVLSTTGLADTYIDLYASVAPKEPIILASASAVNFGYVLMGDSSRSKAFSMSARYLNAGSGALSLQAPAGFAISLNSDSGFVPQLNLPIQADSSVANTTVYARFVAPTSASNTPYAGNLQMLGGGTHINVSLAGIAVTSLVGIAKQYYISPSGSDLLGDGSYHKPWYSLAVAVQSVEPGDTVHCRGGTYRYSERVVLDTSGVAGKRICIFAFRKDDGSYEEPIFDFSAQPYGAANRALHITGNYWYIFGIHITRAGDNGIKLEGSHCIVERCVFSYNGDTGLQLGFGHNFTDTHPGLSKNDGSYCAYNLVVDCDSYQNYDSDSKGGDADGFACKMHNGKENWFVRCRAWNNSDDAWDLFETDFPVYIVECWAWHSGDPSQHVVDGGSFQGNGNGIKLGGNGTGGSSMGKHEVWNSVSFNNNKTNSVKGFDQNNHKYGVRLVNCLAFNNGYDFMFEDAPSGTQSEFYNNVCLSNRIEINPTGALMFNNVASSNPEKGWQSALNISPSAADYYNLSEQAAKQARSADGALPTQFARLVETSQLIDQGMNGLVTPKPLFVDQALVGSALADDYVVFGEARDLGPYEVYLGEQCISCADSGETTFARSDRQPSGFGLLPNPATGIVYVDVPGTLSFPQTLRIVGIDGAVRSRSQVLGSGKQAININELPAGMYLMVLGAQVQPFVVE